MELLFNMGIVLQIILVVLCTTWSVALAAFAMAVYNQIYTDLDCEIDFVLVFTGISSSIGSFFLAVFATVLANNIFQMLW